MEALPIVRTILLAAAGVTAKRTGGIHLNVATQGDALPNAVLMSVGGGEGLSHEGADGLLHDRVRIWARAKTAKEADQLGTAIDKALHGYSGTVSGAAVQLVEKVLTTSDHDDKAEVQRSIIDVRIHWRRAP
ncbi:tail completion protein gp17 [Hoeflea sp.]|uniref:tail completion protein gp17 n=1 Tax=Hoeflea sp. TaxID=1940281 RepID=UPI003B51FAB3